MQATPENARDNMIEQQIRPWEVFDRRVLQLYEQLPRERFVPTAFRGLAFADIEVPLGHGESMMAPRVEARMLQALAPRPGERALEIGTGSGFTTACLAQLAGAVDSIDIHEEFVATADDRLRELAIDTASIRAGDALDTDWPQQSYDLIAVTGALVERNPCLEQALRPGGRLFVVLGQAPVMTAYLIRRVDAEEFLSEPLFETLLTPLRNGPSGERFEF